MGKNGEGAGDAEHSDLHNSWEAIIERRYCFSYKLPDFRVKRPRKARGLEREEGPPLSEGETTTNPSRTLGQSAKGGITKAGAKQGRRV